MSLTATEVPPPSQGPFDPHDGSWAFPKKEHVPSGGLESQDKTNNVPTYAKQQQQQQIQM